jgi:hypothetical protein
MTKHLRLGSFVVALVVALGLVTPTLATEAVEPTPESEPLLVAESVESCIADAAASPLDVPVEQQPIQMGCLSGYTCPLNEVRFCPQFIGVSVNCVSGCCEYYGGSCSFACNLNSDCGPGKLCDNGCCVEKTCDFGPTCQNSSDCIPGQSCSGGCCKD